MLTSLSVLSEIVGVYCIICAVIVNNVIEVSEYGTSADKIKKTNTLVYVYLDIFINYILYNTNLMICHCSVNFFADSSIT